MDENFVLEWLRVYFNRPQIEENALKPVLHFSLLWNLFEHTYFTDSIRLNPPRLLELAETASQSLENDFVNRIFLFFKDRYYPNNQIHQRFISLGLDNRRLNGISNYNFCENIITNQNPSMNDKLKVIFLIIHRFRNNLFHGRKDPQTLNIYEQPFNEINFFLCHFIQVTAENDLLNNNRHRRR